MKTIEINQKFYCVPETWNELSKEQLLQVMELLYKKDYPLENALLKLLKILTNMSWWAFFRAPVTTVQRYKFRWKNFRLSLGEALFLSKVEHTGLEEFLYLSDFLITANELTKNLLPQYRGFYGPAAEMYNVTMDEFVFSEDFYMQWAETKDDETPLNELVAVLYRPARLKYNKEKNEKGDIRIAFNENLCSYYAKTEICHWPLNVKTSIAQFYQACRDKWIHDNPDVFEGGTRDTPAQYGMISVMRGVAKSGVHGSTIEDVGRCYVNAILMELNELVQEAREHERQMKSIRNA